MSKKEYTADTIEAHEGLDGVRTRPTVYIGSINKEGVYRLFLEAIGNVIDEFNAGRCKGVDISYDSKECRFVVQDYALGIPIEKFHDVLTRLHVGGKFGKSTYDYSIGLNGLGLKCINALSKVFVVDTYYNGKHGHFVSEKSIEKDFWIKDDKNHQSGTRVEWIPDITIMEELGADYEKYSDMLNMNAYINAGFDIKLTWDGKTQEFCHPDGLLGYFSGPILKSHHMHALSKPISFMNKQSIPKPQDPSKSINMEYFVYFTWAENIKSEYVESYVNGLRTISGGSHVTGTHMAITKAIKDYIDKNNLMPKNAKFDVDGNDVRETLVLVVNANHSDPKYTTQVKDALDNKDLQFFINTSLYPAMQLWLSDNKQIADNICKLVLRSAKARQAAKDAKDNIIKANTRLSIGSVDLKKFSPCKSKDPDRAELFIVEGDSAKGSAKEARDTSYQAVFAVRGKGQNVFSTSNPKLSDENAMLVDVLGCGIGPTFDIKKLRFHKIILAADADNDGANIRLLLTGFFFKYFIPIIEAGYLYEAIPPLFQITIGKGKDARSVYLPDQASFDLAVSYIAKQTFYLESIRGQKISEDVAGIYINKLAGYKAFIELFATQTGIEAELLEYIVRYYSDIVSGKFNKLNLLDYDCKVLSKSDSYMHINIDRGYEHYFVVLDNLFYKNVYLPIAKKLSDIYLMDVVFVGKNTGMKYGGSTYRNSKFIESILVNKNSTVGRLKGLGESDAKDLNYYMFAPKTRILRQLHMSDITKASNTMDMCLGHNIDARKEFCMNGH